MRRTGGTWIPRRSSLACASGIFAALLIGGASAVGQTLVHTFSGPTADGYGESVAGPGDLDGDGYGDVVVHASTPVFVPHYLSWRSGANGSVLQTTTSVGGFANAYNGTAPRIGDLNGDGHADVLAVINAAPLPFVAQIYSGADASSLLSVSLPAGNVRPFGVGDFDGDGVPDFALGNHSYWTTGMFGGCNWFPGTAAVRSGATGAVLFSTSGSVGKKFADIVEPLGDAVGSPSDDFAIVTTGRGVPGHYLYCPGSTNTSASISVRSGGTGGEVAFWTYPWVGFPGYGEFAAAGGADFDFDGRNDVVVAQKVGPPIVTSTSIWVRSPLTGAVLASTLGAASGFTLQGVVVVGDVDGDLVPDFVVSESGSSTVYSGATCATLSSIAAPSGVTFGRPAEVGDLDGDGVREFAVAAKFIGGPNNEVRVYSPKTLPAPSVSIVGAACGGATTFALAATPPLIGATATFTLTGGPAFAPAIVVLSDVPTAPTLVSAGPGFGSTCPLQLDFQSLVVLDATNLSAVGGWSFALAVPNAPELVGRSFGLNAAYLLSGGGMGLSNGVIGVAGY